MRRSVSSFSKEIAIMVGQTGISISWLGIDEAFGEPCFGVGKRQGRLTGTRTFGSCFGASAAGQQSELARRGFGIRCIYPEQKPRLGAVRSGPE